MLVLSRNLDQEVIINDNIKVKILKIRGNQVTLGFEAEKDITIHRKEIFERIQNQKIK